jgi:histidine ammonia-lyase
LPEEERDAVRSGGAIATATALAGLFEAERVFQSALVAEATSNAAAGLAVAPASPRALKLTRQPALIHVVTARSQLAAGANGMSPARVALPNIREADDPGFMAVSLDALRHAGEVLARQANSVGEERLYFWQTGELAGGVAGTGFTVRAAECIASALRGIASGSARRVLRTERAGAADASSAMKIARAFLAEMQESRSDAATQSEEADDDSEPPRGTAVEQLLPLAGKAALVVLLEFLTAAKVLGSDGDQRVPPALHPVLLLLADRLPIDADGHAVTALDLAMAADLVRSGALAAAPGIDLPGVAR